MKRTPHVARAIVTAAVMWLFVAAGLSIAVHSTKGCERAEKSGTLIAQAAPSQLPIPKADSPERSKTEQYTLKTERYEKAIAYSHAEYVLYFASFLFDVLVLIAILRLGIAARLRDFAESYGSSRIVQGLVFIPLLFLLCDVLDLPVRLGWHALSLHYEMSIQRWGSWFLDWTKEELITVGTALVLVLVLTAIMRRSPRRWWFYYWLAALPILLFEFFISPWVIDPLFNKFDPLAQKYPALVESIGKLTDRAGVPVPPERMFLMKASEKTNTVNAYVTGFGASKRVVVWDNTIQKMSTDETLFIVGHELGHYVLGHVRNGFLVFAGGLLLALYVMFRGLHWALDHWGKDWRIYGQEDWASIAALLLLLQFLMFFSAPVMSGFTRMQEHNADIYGLELIHGVVPDSEEAAAHAFQILGEEDLADPNPPAFITFWLYTHPPLADRLVFAHSYDPWSKGEPPKYVKK